MRDAEVAIRRWWVDGGGGENTCRSVIGEPVGLESSGEDCCTERGCHGNFSEAESPVNGLVWLLHFAVCDRWCTLWERELTRGDNSSFLQFALDFGFGGPGT